MSFLFPLYLLGAVALAVPVLLHLRRRPPKEHLPFGSLMFLEKSPERLVRRTRIERWILLALRCLALALLALAFSRPFLRPGAAEEEGAPLARTVVLVDRSASLRREDLWDRALAAAREAVEGAAAEEEVALAFFDEEFELAAGFPDWAELAPRTRAGRFDEAVAAGREAPGWRGADLGEGLLRAADLLLAADAGAPAVRREIVLVSDFKNGARRDALGHAAWPEEVAVRCVPLAPEASGNLTLQLAASPPRSRIDDEEVHRVRVSNAADSDFTAAAVQWKGHPETRIGLELAPGTSRIVTAAPRPPDAGRGTLVLEGDAHPFDNEVHVAPLQPRPLRVLYVDEGGLSEEAGSPLFYLRRALQPTPALEPVLSVSESVSEGVLEQVEIVVLAGSWNPGTAAALHEFAARGGAVLALPSEALAREGGEGSLAALAGEDWKLSEAEVRDYAMLADLDFGHPVLEPFARAQIRDFTRIRFWRHRHLELPSPAPEATRVVATFDRRSPALVEHRVGEGAVFAFLSGWEPQDSQLALSSKFVPLLYSIFAHSGFSVRAAPTLHVGENGHAEPGFYEKEDGDGFRLVAVNLAPGAGDTTPFDPAVVLPELGVPLAAEDAVPLAALSEAGRARLAAEEREQRQKMWKWLVLGTLAFLIAETWLAGRFRVAARPGEGVPATPARA